MTTQYDFVFGTETEGQKRPAAPMAVSANSIVYVALLILVGITAFLIGVMFERRANTANATELATLWQAWDIIEDNYYGTMPDADTRRYGAIQGLVTALGDPFTSYAPPEVAVVRRQEIDGHFGGIGIMIEPNENFQIRVVNVIPGNPAHQVGILAGDVFIEVDGQNVENITTERLGEVVRGQVGTEVKLKMYRPSTDEFYEVEVTRAIIETPTVFSENIDGIGHIMLTTFNGVATSQLEEHIKALMREDVRGIVLDIRGNGGGLLDQAVSVADLFLDAGDVLIQRSNTSEDVFRSDSGDIAEEIPLVVLIDGATASASEVLAGALQDRERATLIGLPTFGKGVVQLVFNLADGSQLRVTSSAWYTPNDRAIHQQGLQPDLAITGVAYDMLGNDLILQAGIDYLNELLDEGDSESPAPIRTEFDPEAELEIEATSTPQIGTESE